MVLVWVSSDFVHKPQWSDRCIIGELPSNSCNMMLNLRLSLICHEWIRLRSAVLVSRPVLVSRRYGMIPIRYLLTFGTPWLTQEYIILIFFFVFSIFSFLYFFLDLYFKNFIGLLSNLLFWPYFVSWNWIGTCPTNVFISRNICSTTNWIDFNIFKVQNTYRHLRSGGVCCNS